MGYVSSGADAPASRKTDWTMVEYYAVDAIGSVRVVFDAAGTVTSRTDYASFGEQLAPSTLGAKARRDS